MFSGFEANNKNNDKTEKVTVTHNARFENCPIVQSNQIQPARYNYCPRTGKACIQFQDLAGNHAYKTSLTLHMYKRYYCEK